MLRKKRENGKHKKHSKNLYVMQKVRFRNPTVSEPQANEKFDTHIHDRTRLDKYFTNK